MDSREREDRRVATILRQAGLEVNSVYDLVNTQNRYHEHFPLLVSLLSTTEDPVIKEGLVRALTVKQAGKHATGRLIEEFRKIGLHAPKLSLQWAIGNALSVMATDAYFKEIVELATNEGYGKAREMVVYALGNMKKTPEAIDVLIKLLDDDKMAGYAAMALGKLKATRAEPKIKELLEHPREWVRKKASKVLRKIQGSGNPGESGGQATTS